MTTTDLPLSGQSAFVTGGATGIGLECARRLVDDGASVTIAGRREDRLQASTAELSERAVDGADVAYAVCDVADEAQVQAAVATAVATGAHGLHLCVASAGGGGVGPILSTSLEEWDRILGTNLTGTFLTFKHAGAAIARSGGGSMVAISSIAAAVTHRFMAPYCVSKVAIDALVRNLADELGVAGVRVNSVRPGFVETELMELVDDATRADYLSIMPVSRLGEPADVASLVRFLLGPESSWITGTNVSVDGGHHLRRGPNFEPVARLLYGDAVDGVIPEA